VPKVGFSISEDLYKVLESVAKGRGISVHQLVKEIVALHALKLTSQVNLVKLTSQVNLVKLTSQVNLASLPENDTQVNFAKLTSENGPQNQAGDELDKRFEDLEQRLDKRLRRFEDLVNTYTGKTDQVLQRFSLLIEAIESLNEKLVRVVELLSKQQDLAKLSEERQRVSEERSVKEAGREKRDKCEILRKELAVFESEIGAKIRNRDKFFASLERDCEAVVIECARERVAVEKGFWQSFLDKLSKIDTTDDDKIKRLLGMSEFKLFKVLKESALLYFNASEKRWALAGGIGIVSSTTKTDTSTESDTTTHGNSTTKQHSHTKKPHYRKSYEDDESWLLQYADIE
jgi:hypothetical protein